MPKAVPTHNPFKRVPAVPTRQKPRSEDDAAWKRFIDGRAWRRLSALYRRLRPACEWCLSAHNILVPAEHVHHLKGQSPEHRLDWDWLYGLCKSCHSRVTLAEQRGEAIRYPPRVQHAVPSTHGGP